MTRFYIAIVKDTAFAGLTKVARELTLKNLENTKRKYKNEQKTERVGYRKFKENAELFGAIYYVVSSKVIENPLTEKKVEVPTIFFSEFAAVKSGNNIHIFLGERYKNKILKDLGVPKEKINFSNFEKNFIEYLNTAKRDDPCYNTVFGEQIESVGREGYDENGHHLIEDYESEEDREDEIEMTLDGGAKLKVSTPSAVETIHLSSNKINLFNSQQREFADIFTTLDEMFKIMNEAQERYRGCKHI